MSCCFLPLPSQLSTWAAVAGKALGLGGLRRCRYLIIIRIIIIIMVMMMMYRSCDKTGQLQWDANKWKFHWNS